MMEFRNSGIQALLLKGDLSLRQPLIKVIKQLAKHNSSLYKQRTGQNRAKLFEMLICISKIVL